VRYAALQKFPELQLKHTEEEWDAMAGGFQRRVISAEKERLSANKENVTVQDLWARSKMKRDRKKSISKLTERIYRRAFGMRSVGLVHKFGGPAVRNVDAARDQYHARRERSTQKHSKADHPVSYVRGEVPVSLQASSLTYVFPPSDLLERLDAPGSRASRPKVAVLRAAAPVAMHVNITEQQKLKAVQHLCKDLPAEALQRIGLERTGEQSAVTRIPLVDAPATYTSYPHASVSSSCSIHTVTHSNKKRHNAPGEAHHLAWASHGFSFSRDTILAVVVWSRYGTSLQQN
jgi:hypothetical protein